MCDSVGKPRGLHYVCPVMKTRTFILILIIVAALLGAAIFMHSPRGQEAHSAISPIHGGR